MTVLIRQSQVNMDRATFAARVEAYQQAKQAHRFTENVAAPTEHPLIEACVLRAPQGEGKPDEFVLNYEFVDDTPRLEGADA